MNLNPTEVSSAMKNWSASYRTSTKEKTTDSTVSTAWSCTWIEERKRLLNRITTIPYKKPLSDHHSDRESEPDINDQSQNKPIFRTTQIYWKEP